METSIAVSRILTKIESLNFYSTVTNHKMAELTSLIASVDRFDFSGTASVKKFARLEGEIIAAGFKPTHVSHKNEFIENALSFRITYARA